MQRYKIIVPELGLDRQPTVLGPWPLERTHANVAQAAEEAVLLDSTAESGPFRVVNRPPDVDGVATGMEFVGETNVTDHGPGDRTAEKDKPEDGRVRRSMV